MTYMHTMFTNRVFLCEKVLVISYRNLYIETGEKGSSAKLQKVQTSFKTILMLNLHSSQHLAEIQTTAD